MTSNFASASAPQPLKGPDSFQRLRGTVISVQKIKKTIGTSDVTSEKREYLEVKFKVEHAEVVEVDIEPSSDKEELNASSPETNQKSKVKPNLELQGKIRSLYFKSDEPIHKDEQLEIATRSRSSISYGWTSSEFGATYKKMSLQHK